MQPGQILNKEKLIMNQSRRILMFTFCGLLGTVLLSPLQKVEARENLCRKCGKIHSAWGASPFGACPIDIEWHGNNNVRPLSAATPSRPFGPVRANLSNRGNFDKLQRPNRFTVPASGGAKRPQRFVSPRRPTTNGRNRGGLKARQPAATLRQAESTRSRQVPAVFRSRSALKR